MIDYDRVLDLMLDGQVGELDSILAVVEAKSIETENDRWNLLHLATKPLRENATPQILRLLAERGVDVNAADRCGYRPLHFLARKKDFPGIECLLDLGANPNVLTNEKRTPLRLCLEKNPLNLKVVELLLDKGADPDLGGNSSARALVDDEEYDERVDVIQLFRQRSKT